MITTNGKIITVLSVLFFSAAIFWMLDDGFQSSDIFLITFFLWCILRNLYPGVLRFPPQLAVDEDPEDKKKAMAAYQDKWQLHWLACIVISFMGWQYGPLLFLPFLGLVQIIPENYTIVRTLLFFGFSAYIGWLYGLVGVFINKIPVTIKSLVLPTGFSLSLVYFLGARFEYPIWAVIVFCFWNAAAAMLSASVFSKYIYKASEDEANKEQSVLSAVMLPLPILVVLTIILMGFSNNSPSHPDTNLKMLEQQGEITMTIDQFWNIIDQAHAGAEDDMERKSELLEEQLEELSDEDLLAFLKHFDKAFDDAYTWELWAAAYIINGGCGDDSFMDFRATLISHGREVYEKILANPESLADFGKKPDEYWVYEGFQYVPMDVVEERLGDTPQRYAPAPDEPSGRQWNEDNVNDLYPRLAQMYL